MNKKVEPLHLSDPLEIAKIRLAKMHARGLPVVDAQGRLSGILAMSDFEDKLLDEQSTVEQLCQEHTTVTYPQETLADALKKMSRLDIGQLPVVLPEAPDQLAGMIYRQDVIHAYAVATQRRL